MRVIDWRGKNLEPHWLEQNVPRVSTDQSALDEVVAGLLEDVRGRGLEAIVEQAQKFDGVATAPRRYNPSTEKSAEIVPTQLAQAIGTAISRVRLASLTQVPSATEVSLAEGARIVQRYVPVDRAGVYIPGGKAVYPSSVIMNVVAAQAAGVPEIALVSPPQAKYGGSVHPSIDYTARELGVSEAYPIGGVAAIAALAYGLPEIGFRPVSLISGPGNAYVATAKRLVRSHVGIDSEAGPTEICVIADHTATPEWVASDLISQAEHDESAQAVLVTTEITLAESVSRAVTEQLSTTAHAERAGSALGSAQSAVIVVDNLEAALAVSDALAPEHLEIHTENAWELAQRVRHAGAVFVGPHTPVSLGDYLAGSNHVLPTGGRARFQSGLSALTFLRPQQIVEYDRRALGDVASQVVDFAMAEDLPAHADAITARFTHASSSAAGE